MGFCDDDPRRLRARGRAARATCASSRRPSRRTRATLPAASPPAPDLAPGAADEERAAFGLQLNAVNFGSGWFPTLRKPPGLSGFRTVEAGAARPRAVARGELAGLDAAGGGRARSARTPGHELMALFARALRELGAHVAASTAAASSRSRAAATARPSALAARLGALPRWRDVSRYDGEPVPFFKRAQLAAADLRLQGLAPARRPRRAHALRRQPRPARAAARRRAALRRRSSSRASTREELLEHGSPEEVEIRACAVHAVELLVAARGATTATAVDNVLWHRGGGPRYKARPRHRARTTGPTSTSSSP